ncbi:phage holin family protein [Pseudoxanthomonas sacheonensis]|uniref:phage holin family protein n=1 Tax=Pseudoxanthomonas sacheonensis TaxID=443615 RepID=UPI0013D843FE
MSDNELPGASAGDEPQADVKPPHLDESVRRIGAAGKATLASARDTGRALRRLISADLALARSAMGRALAWVAVGIVFGASAWLLVVGALIAVLQRLGWSWLQSLSFAAVLSSVVTAVAVWRTIHYFECAGLHATRRQLARLGIGDEGEEEEDGKPGTPP